MTILGVHTKQSASEPGAIIDQHVTMNSKKIQTFSILTGLAAAALFFSACGGSSDKPEPAKQDLSIGSPAAAVEGNLLNASGAPVDASVLNDKELTAFYFSASWCPPCRAFTPLLVEYANMNKERMNVVLVSGDRSAEDQQKYLDNYKMPFYAVRHDSAPVYTLNSEFGVRFIPTLVVVDRNGKVLTTDGVAAVRNGQVFAGESR